MNNNSTRTGGWSIILTRPQESAEKTAQRFRDAGAASDQIVIAPLLRIITTASSLGPVAGETVIFTSENGVRAIAPPRRETTAWCVGPNTAAAARDRGFHVEIAGGNADSLIAELERKRPSGKLVWFRGNHVAVDITARLRDLDMEVRSETVYQQDSLHLTREATERLRSSPCILPVYSPRTAEVLTREAHELPDHGHIICCLGDRVRKACGLDWHKRQARDADSLFNLTLGAMATPCESSVSVNRAGNS